MSTITPIMDPNRQWSTWYIDQIYTGSGTGRIVPNVNDLVISYTDGYRRVTGVDYTTGLSTLGPAGALDRNISGGPDLESLLVSKGPGSVSESFRILVDGSVVPHRMDLDTRVRYFDDNTAYMKLFLGTDVETGQVISRVYDSNGVAISENIPMISVGGQNSTERRPVEAHVSQNLPSGTVVTAVFYTQDGTPVSKQAFLVNNTRFVRRLEASARRILSIELESSFLSSTENNVLEIPINIPFQAIDLRGIVHYTDGSVTMPIDGNKFEVFGLRQILATQLGQRQPFSLVYRLSPTEQADNIVGGVNNPSLSVSYEAVVARVDNAYTLKLFTFPTWIDSSNGYRLQHWLYNLERNICYNVTDLVRLAANSPAFQPTLYSAAQTMIFTLDISEVDPSFRNYRHLQSTTITLLRHGTEQQTKWTVSYDPNKPAYGADVNAVAQFINANLWKLRIGQDFNSKEHFLNETYYKVLPIFDPTTEARPIEPNYIRIKAGSYVNEFSIDMWNEELTVQTHLAAGSLVTIEFVKRVGNDDLELAIVGMPIRAAL